MLSEHIDFDHPPFIHATLLILQIDFVKKG